MERLVLLVFATVVVVHPLWSLRLCKLGVGGVGVGGSLF